MKKFTFTLLVFFIGFSSFAQKVDKQDVEFQYIQLPTHPLSNSIKNYHSEVELAYEADILAQKKKLQDDYDQEMADYPQKLEDAKAAYDASVAKYEADIAAWNEKSTASKIVEKKILEENNKPVKPGTFYPPSKPYLREISHEKVFNKEMLANSYLKLDGFNLSNDNALQIKATLYGFDNTEAELKTKESSLYDSKTKQTTKVITYWYEVTYKHPINIKITLPNGETLVDETFEEFNSYAIAKSSEKKGGQPSFNQQSFVESLQNKVVENNMKVIKDFMNNNYGFPKVSRKTTIYRVESKSMDYADYQEAFELASTGYNKLQSDGNTASQNISKAIGIWEKAMTESSPEDKKARIDADVTTITLFNLAEAYIWINDFDQSEACLNKIIALKPSKKEKSLVDDYRLLIKDQKERFDANRS